MGPMCSRCLEGLSGAYLVTTVDSHPTISVVTCCYNQGAFMEQNIQSVLAQNIPNVEHIVVDSGSDNTSEICSRFPHVSYHFQEPAGQCAALNYGFSKATGDIIAWLNSDDYYEPDIFSDIIKRLNQSDGKTLIGGEANVVNENGQLMWKLKNGRVPFFRLLAHPHLYRMSGRTCMPCQPAVFFHRSLLEDIGDLRTDLKYGMDYEFWLRALTHGYHFQHVKKVFANYRYHDSSLTVSDGYDIFLSDWDSVSDEYFNKLSPKQRSYAQLWRSFFILESSLFRRHTWAQERLQRIHANPGELSKAQCCALYAVAILKAPWMLPGMIYRTLHPNR